jgi:hypothetical protein
VLATGAVTLLAVGWLLWGTTPVLPDGPLVARRGEDGKFKVEGTLSGSGLNGRLNALKVKQSRTTVSSHSTSDGTAVLARTVALFNLSDSLFGQRLGYDLFQKLQGTGRFREVRYLPHGESLPDGERLPDLFATIEVLDLKEGGIAPSTTLDAKVRVTLSDQYERSSHSVLGNLTPPSLQFRWDSTVECQAKNVGIETGSAKYAGVSEDLTKDIAKELGDYLDKQVADIGELSEPSPEFLPDYQPLEGLEFLRSLNAGHERPAVHDLKRHRVADRPAGDGRRNDEGAGRWPGRRRLGITGSGQRGIQNGVRGPPQGETEHGRVLRATGRTFPEDRPDTRVCRVDDANVVQGHRGRREGTRRAG